MQQGIATHCKSLHPSSILGQASSFPLGDASESGPTGWNETEANGAYRDQKSRPVHRPGSRGVLGHIIRGCGYVDGYGEHPGTLTLFAFVAMGAAAGARGGWIGAALGAAGMLAVFGPMYLYGAYERSRDASR